MTKALPLFAALALLLGACSVSNQIAQQKDYNDDVYYSDATAREITAIEKAEKQAALEQQQNNRPQNLRGDIYNNYYPYYPGGIYYQVAPWRNPYYHSYNHFYDPYLDYYGYNNWYAPDVSIYVYPFRNYYGYPYFGSTYWGPVTANNYYPGYSYPYSGRNYYPVITDPNYRARPLRGSENIGGMVRPLGTIRTDANGAIMSTPSRGETYEKNNGTASSGGRTSSSTSGSTTNNSRSRPARTQTTSPDSQRNIFDASPRESAPQTIMSQPSSSGNSNSSGGSSSSGSSDDGSRARPARVGN